MNTEPTTITAEDRELLRQYAEEASAAAFTELVRRHVNLVFSAALRRVNGDHALAEDVTQMVFTDFASKARSIAPEMPLSGWLHRHTGFVASKLIDRERRRKSREHTAAAMNSLAILEPPDQAWVEHAPLLDAAMDALTASDRDAIVLRFFEQKDFRSVGAALGLSDDSAQKKVSRALEKLRADLSRRGVLSPAGALASLLAIYAVSTAPQAVAGVISQNALAGAAVAEQSLWASLTALRTAARVKLAAGAIAALLTVAYVSTSLTRSPDSRSDRSVGSVSTASGVVPTAPPTPPAALTVVPPKPTAADLVASAAAAWTASKGVAATSKALGFLSQINFTEIPQALNRALEFPDGPVRSLLKTHLLNLWAEAEPQAALAWVNEHPEPNRADLNQGILDTWAAHDPNAVQKAVGKGGSFKVMTMPERVTATLFRTLAQRDLSQAFARLGDISSPNDRGQAMRGILETVQNEGDRFRIFSMIDTIKNDEIRIQARRASVEHWAGTNPQAAAEYVEKAQPRWERTRLMDSLGLTWLQSDPNRAAAWWMAHAPGPDTLVKIVNVWTQHNANSAGEWLRQQPTGPASDAARMTFSRQVADLDPESALRWAETVSDLTMREGTIDHVFANWNERDANAASKFLTSSGWSAERIDRLTKSP